jgi:hypothetical protein
VRGGASWVCGIALETHLSQLAEKVVLIGTVEAEQVFPVGP